MNVSKENDKALLNQHVSSVQSRESNWKPMNKMCSPVREDSIAEEESFMTDAEAIVKRLEKDKSKVVPQIRRHSLANNSSKLSSKPLRSKLSTVHSDRRVSFGGVMTHGSTADPYTAHVNSDLKDELAKRLHLDQTRQQRLNGMDIKLKQATLQIEKMRAQCDQERRAKEAIQRQLADMKRSHKMLRETLRRRDEQIKKLGGVKGPESVGSTESEQWKQKEVFKDAEDVLNGSLTSDDTPVTTRRFTMGPGEISRLRKKQLNHTPLTASVNKDARYVRVDCLEKGYNSHKLLELVKQYGGIASLRVTSDVVTSVLKGYITFLSPLNAQAAIRGLREMGYKATLVDKA